jgi:hypothetical protein
MLMKGILSLATVAALMAVMLVVMASAALAVPPASGSTGCDGGLNNANHATYQTSVTDNMKADQAPGTENNPGIEQHVHFSGPFSYTTAGNCERD